MASKKYEEKYTKPDLRERLKEEIKQSDKGGKSGQWSARKSQLLVQEYEKQGGGYRNDEKDEAAQSLENWSEQDWQTAEGDADARKKDKTKRYLPKAVWEQLSEEEKKEAERTKEQASKKGEQHVAWTPAIKQAFQKAGYAEDGSRITKKDLYARAQELNIEGRSSMSRDKLQEAIWQAEQSDLEHKTKEELYDLAQNQDIEGRSQMSKDELKQALKER